MNYFILFLLFVTCFYNLVYCMKFKQILMSIEDCILPEDAYDCEDYILHNITMVLDQRSRYMKANFTIRKQTKPINHNIRGYKVRNSTKWLDFNVSKVNCKHPVLAHIFKIVKVKYDMEKCIGLPGNYTISKFTLKDITKIFRTILIGSGKYIFELEMFTDKGVVLCLSVSLNTFK